MKTHSLLLTLATLLVVSFMTSCLPDPEEDDPAPAKGDRYASFFDLIEQNKVKPYEVKIDPRENNEFEGPAGTVVRIPGDALVDQSGSPVTGPVSVFLREFYSRMDIVLSGINTNTNNQMLVTGGAIELKASRNGQPLQLADGAGIVAAFPTANTANQTNGYEDKMQLFASEDDPEVPGTPFTWQLANDIPARIDSNAGSTPGFILNNLQLGWSNCDALYTIPASERTQFEVNLSKAADGPLTGGPESSVYLLVKDLSTVINLYTRNGPAYTTYVGSVPMGLEATLVAISVINDQLYFGSEKITVAGDDSFSVEVSPGTTAELKALLDNPF